MENLILSFNVVLPLFLCIALGYFLRRIGMMQDAVRSGLNQLSFRVFLPFYLFCNIYTTDMAAAFDLKLILFGVIALLVLFAVLMVVIPMVEKENRRRGVLVQGMFRGNFALFGLPVALSLCGEAGLGPTSLLVGVTVPVFNVLAVVALETFRGGKPDLRKILRGIATNPLIISSLLGIACNLLQVKLPEAVLKSVSDLGRTATPLSLVALGASFTFASAARFRRQLTIGVVGKLIISPAIMVTIAAMMGLRNDTLVPLLIMFGAPTAVSSFPMAQQMDGDGDLAAALVVFTSAGAILTMFLFIFILKELALI